MASALPAVPSLGTSFALDPAPRRRAVGGLAGIIGAAVLVAGAVGVATVERSRHTLLSTSALYGADWDYELGLDGVDPATVLPALFVLAALLGFPGVDRLGGNAVLLLADAHGEDGLGADHAVDDFLADAEVLGKFLDGQVGFQVRSLVWGRRSSAW